MARRTKPVPDVLASLYRILHLNSEIILLAKNIINNLIYYCLFVAIEAQRGHYLTEMKITSSKPSDQGFDLKEPIFGLAALAIVAHFASPRLTEFSQETGMQLGDTTEDVSSILSRRF
jgi:hypothetical protein